jgi:hypothetical protein
VGTENSRRVLVVMSVGVVADGTGMTVSVAGGVAEEEAVRDRLFLRSASGLVV